MSIVTVEQMEFVIKRTPTPYGCDDLARDFAALGVEQGDTLLVHCSMRSIGFVIGHTETVISALQQAVGESGTIVMPAQSTDNSNPEHWQAPPVPDAWIPIIKAKTPAFDPRLTRTRGIGQLPEHFRTFPDVLRSAHPATSFCAWGRHAKFITAEHPYDNGLGEQSPLGKLEQLNTKIVMIGTEYDTCTAMHLAEYRTQLASKQTSEAAVMHNGKREWIQYQDLALDSDQFVAIGEHYEQQYPDAVSRGNLGNANCRVVDMKALVSFTATSMLTTATALSFAKMNDSQ